MVKMTILDQFGLVHLPAVLQPLLRGVIDRQTFSGRSIGTSGREGIRKNLFSGNVRAACLQNETAPEKLLNRYEKRFEKRERGSEKRSETRPKSF